MSPYQILSSFLLFLLILLIEICNINGETLNRTNANTNICDVNNCQSYSSLNSSWLLPDGNGCKNKVDGINICISCPDENNECNCLICAFDTIVLKVIDGDHDHDLFEGTASDSSTSSTSSTSSLHIDGIRISKKTIILIVVGIIIGLCCIIYCICGGAIFIYQVNKEKRNTTNATNDDHQQTLLV